MIYKGKVIWWKNVGLLKFEIIIIFSTSIVTLSISLELQLSKSEGLSMKFMHFHKTCPNVDKPTPL